MKVKINKKNFDCDIACIVASQAHWKYVPPPTFLQKNVPICTNRCSFQLKLTLEAVKLWQLLFHFTKILIYSTRVIQLRMPNFSTIACTILCYHFKTILSCCKIWKLLLFNIRVYSHLSCLVLLNRTQVCLPLCCGSHRDQAEEVV